MTRTIQTALIVMTLMLGTPIASSQIFLTKTPFWRSGEAGVYSTGMVWRDCNNDGFIDVFFSNGNDMALAQNSIYLSDNGTLPSAASWLSTNYEYSGHCAVGDVNDDGRPDFAVANYLGSGRFGTANHSNLYLNSNGIPHTSPDWYTADSIYAFSCAFGDADGDGDLDLAFATGEIYNDRSQESRIYYNINGTLQTAPGWQSAQPAQALDVTWGDVDNDGDLDLAFACDDRPPAVYYNNNGVIETTPSWQAFDNESSNTIIFGDVNSDGWLDLIVAFNYQLGGNGYFQVYFNTGIGILDRNYGWRSADGGYGSGLALCDIDQDGDPDLAAGRWWDRPRVYENLGTTFSSEPAWRADSESVVEKLAWVDVDGNGVVGFADTITQVTAKKVFYASRAPLHAIDSVCVDGMRLGERDYCYDLVSAWVALAQAPADTVIIYHRYSTMNDLAVANWDTYNMVYQYAVNIISMQSHQFSDALGDADGIPEAGETITLAVTISNSGGDVAEGVSVSLSADDATLSILDGDAYLGDIASMSSADNSSDPFEFEIPADYASRIDSFFIEVSWNGGADKDTFVIEAAMGKPAVLLVDDDNGDNLESHYIGCLYRQRIPYNQWTVAASGVPDSAAMSQFELVIWYIGDYRPSPLDGSEIAAMKGFLDGTGSLFLTGQGIAAQLNSTDPAFLSTYLKSNYQSTLYVPVLEAVAGGQIFTPGIKIALIGGGGASNQTNPDLIAPVNGGVAEMRYVNQTNYGGVSFSGQNKLLFFSFGFEAIASGDSRWRDRDSIFADIIEYFGIRLPGSYPIVTNLTTASGDSAHVTDHAPVMTWAYFDPSSLLQHGYQMQVGTNNDWSTAEMWDSGPVVSPDPNTIYAGDELADGGTYYYRVRVSNGVLWSDWYASVFRMNSVPIAVWGLNPAERTGVAADKPTLSHQNTDDPDNDVLTYTYQVFSDSLLTSLVAQAESWPENPAGITSWQVSTSLTDNQMYYWRVRAYDGFENGPCSQSAAFWVNSVNLPPQPFALVAPDSGGLIGDTRPTFDWDDAPDPDPYDIVKYTLSLSSDSEFAAPTIVPNLVSSIYTAENPLLPGTYYWKIAAHDLFGAETAGGSVFVFMIAVRGDANSNGFVDVGDAVYIVNYVFRGGPAPTPQPIAGDANCDGGTDVADAVFLINYIFRGGPPPGCE